eukprot:gnl/MRDRNA2_/MRDRNA2_311753_c0_seq1.p1 gnl/MRDRNA2_/MRDRNA2_311753_c0~~gnl/MRDRNA2_/MRDRNA2_311753_c0_seq1.p1  ORF type:complete len:330 (+),score=37.06 gnl/MRDRNA2_/MRDRNA2_311753_c0_seq1:41-991(+)
MSQHPFFNSMQPRVFKRACALASTVLYAPGDIVVQRGHTANCMCFVIQGKLRILRSRNQVEQSPIVLEAPSWIGDLCLFREMVRTNTVVSITHSELLIFGRDSVAVVLSEFPTLKPTYDAWKLKAENNTDEGDELITCAHCGARGHVAATCPLLMETLENSLPTQLRHENVSKRYVSELQERNSGRSTGQGKFSQVLTASIDSSMRSVFSSMRQLSGLAPTSSSRGIARMTSMRSTPSVSKKDSVAQSQRSFGLLTTSLEIPGAAKPLSRQCSAEKPLSMKTNSFLTPIQSEPPASSPDPSSEEMAGSPSTNRNTE